MKFHNLLALVVAVLVAVTLVPGKAVAQSCKVTVATAGGDFNTVERFLRAMEQALLGSGVPVVRLAPNEAQELMNLRFSFDQSRVRALQQLGACKIVFVSLTRTQQQFVAASNSGSFRLLLDFLNLLGGSQSSELRNLLNLFSGFFQTNQQVTAIRFEANAELVALPRDLLFSDTLTASAAVADSGSALITIGSQSRQVSWSQQSDVDVLTLRTLASELVRRMRHRL